MSTPAAPRTFKERLDALSDLVRQLETGELGLEEAIARFEAGRKLHQELAVELGGYEARLEKLAREPGGDAAGTAPEALAPEGDGDRG